MHVEISYQPSARMVELHGPEAVKFRQDDWFVAPDGSSVAVLDGAPNFLGTKAYQVHYLAASRGLPLNELLNGGLISAAAGVMELAKDQTLTDRLLISRLNSVLSTLYVGLHVPHHAYKDEPWRRGELFTCYMGQVRRDADNNFWVTGVGDVYVYGDGLRVAGEEKLIDRLYGRILDTAATKLDRPRQELYELLMPELNRRQFAFQNRFAPSLEIGEFYAWLIAFIANQLGLTYGQAVDLLEAAGCDFEADLQYPAIDGTTTVGDITVAPFSANCSVLLHTDGYTPAVERPMRLGDLRRANPAHSEALAIQLSDLESPGLTINQV
jgi:hypothetical protein